MRDTKNSKVELLAAAVEYAQDSIVITDTQLESPGPRVIYVNQAFCRMTGYTPEDVIGKTPRILQGPRTDRQVLKRLRQELMKGQVFYGMSVNYRKDGSEFFNEWHIEPIRDEQDCVTHYLALQRDITSQQRLQEDLREQARSLEYRNADLKSLLEQVELEKQKIRQDVSINIQDVALPLIEKLRRYAGPKDIKLLGELELILGQVSDQLGTRAIQRRVNLSPQEVRITGLIRKGLSNKDIARIQGISVKTVETHRSRIRRKLNLVKSSVNLQTYLQGE